MIRCLCTIGRGCISDACIFVEKIVMRNPYVYSMTGRGCLLQKTSRGYANLFEESRQDCSNLIIAVWNSFGLDKIYL